MKHLSAAEAFRLWAYVGVNSFGGPAGQIAVMHREVVERRGLLSERRFIHALNFCMLLPGPEAMQLATYLGWLLNGVPGALLAGVLFIMPGVLIMLGLSVLYVLFGDIGWVAGLLYGVQAAVVVIVVQAMIRIAGRTVRTGFLAVLAAAAFISLFVFAVPFPVVIVVAGVVGWLTGRAAPGRMPPFHPYAEDELKHPAGETRRALLAAVGAVVAWLVPLVMVVGLLGSEHVLAQEALLFSKVALVTFGGAYAALTYVSQVAVIDYGWVSAADMTTGLGLAETTPGPLVLVFQFVGFLAAYNDPGSLAPLLAGVAGAMVAVWATFLPSFAFIFAGAPYVERLRGSRVVHDGLSGISAAVVGVIANLALWFALATFFPDGRVAVADLDVLAVIIAAVAAVLVFWRKWATLPVLGVCASIGLLSALGGWV